MNAILGIATGAGVIATFMAYLYYCKRETTEHEEDRKKKRPAVPRDTSLMKPCRPPRRKRNKTNFSNSLRFSENVGKTLVKAGSYNITKVKPIKIDRRDPVLANKKSNPSRRPSQPSVKTHSDTTSKNLLVFIAGRWKNMKKMLIYKKSKRETLNRNFTV